jgi:glutathione S-transferase
MILPRPDLAELGIKYRRIPLLSIGRDVYLDTRLILSKLEELFPEGRLGASDPQDRFVEQLVQRWYIDGPVFTWVRRVLVQLTRFGGLHGGGGSKGRR